MPANRAATHRWSARKKAEIVLKVLTGDDLAQASQEAGLEESVLREWHETFLFGGIQALKTNLRRSGERKLNDAERKIGQLTLEVEMLRDMLRRNAKDQPRSYVGEVV